MTLQIEGSDVTRVTWSDKATAEPYLLAPQGTEPSMFGTEDGNYYVVVIKPGGWILERADGGGESEEILAPYALPPQLELALQEKIDGAKLA